MKLGHTNRHSVQRGAAESAEKTRRTAGEQSATWRGITRRQWLAATAGAGAVAAIAGCNQEVRFEPSRVSITRAPAYDQSLYGTVRGILEQHGLNVRGKSIVLKPNLVEFEPGNAINTHPLLVHATLEAFHAMGAASVRIAEGPGHRRNTMDLAYEAGYFETIPNFEELFTDLNLDDVARVRPSRQFSRIDKLYLPHTALGADLLVSMPKLKTHHWVGATLSMKNLFGVVPSGVYGWPKNVLHWAGIDQCIADLHAAFPRQFALVDGIVGMEGNGPIQGTPKPAGVLVAGADPVSVDATCCRVMHIDPFRINYLRLASGQVSSHIMERNIRQIGEPIAAVSTPFELPPDFPQIRLETS